MSNWSIVTTDDRLQLVRAMVTLQQRGLNHGTAGNVALRLGKDDMLITPSGVPAHELSPERVVQMSLGGTLLDPGQCPSSEWRMHGAILKHRPEIQAVVHTHSCYATALACVGQDIPAFHYMVAAAGGDSLRCAPYALFGTPELSDLAVQALQDRKACLLGHHGALTCGADLAQAVELAEVIESLCHQYWSVCQLGTPRTLTSQQMAAVLEKFQTYGRCAQSPGA